MNESRSTFFGTNIINMDQTRGSTVTDPFLLFPRHLTKLNQLYLTHVYTYHKAYAIGTSSSV